MRRKNQTAAQRQESIFKFIKEFLLENGYPPSVREIGEAVGLRSSSTVHAYLDMLEDRGLIRRDPAKPRAIDILGEKPWTNTVEVPLLKGVEPGTELHAAENVAEMLQMPADLVGEPGACFVYRVQDDSMDGANIYEGDYLVIDEQTARSKGCIVLAQLENGELVVRRFAQVKRGYHLTAEHEGIKGVISADAKILGKAILVYRRF